MSLAPGTQLGVYDIVALIGAGGMGEVYRARDPRLGRDVAIKVLPAGFSAEPDRLRRFEQEARAAAALNHPNILAVFDIGSHSDSSGHATPYVVAELLEGETLREKLQHGPIPARKASDYAIQIAHGLSAAHDRGIVHRDLKPDNVFLTNDGRIKILDFGLAKLTQPDSPLAAGTNVVTSPVPDHTQAGLVLGTIGYMAPEQVRGQAVDHRADIFAAGAILYEMLCGRRAFKGETTIDTMTAILREDPPDLPIAERHIPPALARIVDRCLEKLPAARFGTAGDLAFALEALTSYSDRTDAGVTAIAAPPKRALIQPAWLGVALLSVALVGAIVLGRLGYLHTTPLDTRVYRSSLLPPPNTLLVDTSPSRRLALSPDGTRLAFTAATSDGRVMLWVRPLNGLGAQPLSGTEGAVAPFWSPDSRTIGFYAGPGNGKLKKIDAAGGPPFALGDFSGGPAGATWNRDDVILFTTTGAGGGPISKVSAAGGAPVVLLTPNSKEQELEYFWPSFLPDGRHFLYLALGKGRTPIGIYVASLDSADRKLLVRGGSNARYADGHLLFLRDSTLMAQRFDPDRLQLSGDPMPVAEQLQMLPPTGAFTVSDNGLLAYQSGATADRTQLLWFDRTGKQAGTLGDPASYGDIQLAPDGRHAAVTIGDFGLGTRDIWTFDVERGLRTRFTFDPATDIGPTWSADGSRIVFLRAPGIRLQKSSTGAGNEEPLPNNGMNLIPEQMSRDGRFLLLSGPPGSSDIWLFPQFGDTKPIPFLQTTFNELHSKFSPDGRWIAYDSNESGGLEVYVRSFPEPGGKWQVSTGGGSFPRWRGDGKELYYLARDGKLMSVPVTASTSAFQPGAASPLFQTRALLSLRYPYDVTSDGQRFLVNTTSEQTASAPITLVVNWAAALKK